MQSSVAHTLSSGRQALELESLRGLAAMLVVIYHMPHWNQVLDGVPIVVSGDRMVPLFFVLSGFIIHSAYAQRIGSWAELGRFQLLRLGRLYPVHLLFLMAFLALELLKLWIASRQPMAYEEAPFSHNTWGALVEQIFLVQGLGLSNSALTFNGPAWSISVELATYAVFGVAVLKLRRRATPFFAALAAASLCLLAFAEVGESYWLLNGFSGFFIGCLTAVAVRRWPVVWPGWMPAVVGAALVLYLALRPHDAQLLAIYPLSALLIAAMALGRDGGFARLMRHRLLVWLGTISYSVYMSHMLVFWCLSLVLKRLLQRPLHPDADGHLVPTLTVPETALAFVLSIGLVLLLSALVHRWVEHPCRAWTRRQLKARPAVAPTPAGPAAQTHS